GLLRRLHIKLGLLNIFRQSSVYAGAVSSLGLLVSSLVVQFGGREVAVFQFSEQLSFMYFLRSRDVELFYRSINFGCDDGLGHRKENGFRSDHLRNIGPLDCSCLHCHHRLLCLFAALTSREQNTAEWC